VKTIATVVLLAKRTQTLVPSTVPRALIVLQIPKPATKDHLNVSHVMLEPFRTLAQRSAPVAIWVGTAAARATVPAARPTNTKTPVVNSNVNHALPQVKCPMNNTQLVPNHRGPPPLTVATTNTSTTCRPTT